MKNISTLGFSLALLFGSLVHAQTFKVAIALPDQNPGVHLQAREIMEIPGTQHFLIAGDVKGNAPGYVNQGFLIRTDNQGDPNLSRGVSTNLSTAFNGVRGAAITMDTEGNYYLGGASVQSFQGVGRGSEKTITSFDGTGNLRWSNMASNWSYEALDFHPDQQQLYAFSGPDNGLYPADLLLSRFAKDGRFIDGIALQNGLENEAAALVSDNHDTYYLVATTAADISPAIYVASVDTSMVLNWGGAYTEAQHTYVPADAAWHPDGYLLITGLATNNLSGRESGFLLALNPDGSERFLQHYLISGFESLHLSGVAGVSSLRNAEVNGAILVGTASDSGAIETRTVAIAVDTAGTIRWVQGYSYYPLGDEVKGEGFSDVIVLSYADEFVAVGQYESHNYGTTLVDRRIAMVRAPLTDGQLDDSGHCLMSMSVSGQAFTTTFTSLGSTISDGTSQGFGYNVSALRTDRTWCTLEYSGGGITPPGSGGKKRIYPFADEFDRFEMRVILPTSSNTLSIGISNPGRLQNLRYEVMDLNGRTIAGAEILPDDQLITVNTARWAQSLYLLRVMHAGETIATQTLIPGPFAQ